MTKEQLDVLEIWIKAIIAYEDRASGTFEAVRLHEIRQDLEQKLGVDQ